MGIGGNCMDTTPYNNSKEDIIRRLKKIEGQVKGLQRMVDNEKYCVDVLVQVAAVRAAIHKVGTIVFENYSRVCLRKAAENDNDKALEELIGILAKFIK
jgi:DNA-binding FrmR family transcriptional regulator